jgi:hypothetical protein
MYPQAGFDAQFMAIQQLSSLDVVPGAGVRLCELSLSAQEIDAFSPDGLLGNSFHIN